MQPQPIQAPPSAPTAQPPAPWEEELNKINMNISGDKVRISGLLDLKGLRLLEARIASLKALLEPLDEGENPMILLGEDDEQKPN